MEKISVSLSPFFYKTVVAPHQGNRSKWIEELAFRGYYAEQDQSGRLAKRVIDLGEEVHVLKSKCQHKDQQIEKLREEINELNFKLKNKGVSMSLLDVEDNTW